MARQENSFQVLSYLFVSELPKLANPGELPVKEEQKETLKGIRVTRPEESFSIAAPSEFKGNTSVRNDSPAPKSYSGNTGLQAATDSQYSLANNPLSSFAALAKYSGGDLSTVSTITPGRVANTSLQKMEENREANRYEPAEGEYAKSQGYIENDVFAKDEHVPFYSEAYLQLPESEPPEKIDVDASISEQTRTVTVKQLDGQHEKDENGNYVLDEDGNKIATYKTVTVDLDEAQTVNSKLENVVKLFTKNEEEETEIEFADASRVAAMFAGWGDPKKTKLSGFDETDSMKAYSENATTLSHNINIIGNDIAETLNRGTKDFWLSTSELDTVGLKTTGISDEHIDQLKNSKIISYGKFLKLDHVQIDGKWNDTKFWTKLFSKNTLTEIGAAIVDAFADVGSAALKSLMSLTNIAPDNTNWGELLYGQGIDISKSEAGKKEEYQKLLGKNSKKELDDVKKGAYIEEEKEPWELGTKTTQKPSAVFERLDYGKAGELEDYITEKFFKPDGSDEAFSHLHKIISQDPLLSQYQYDLQIKSSGAFPRVSALNSFHNVNEGYMNYRITGITFPGANRSATSSHYGVDVFTTFSDLQAAPEHKAEITILVDRDYDVLYNFMATAGTLETYTLNQKAIYNLSAVTQAEGWRDNTNATITVRNGRDLAKSIFFENPDWELGKGLSVGTLKETTGYDSSGYNPETMKKTTSENTKSGSLVTYNKIPVFHFGNFRVINTDYEFKFSSGNTSPAEMKVTVTWSKMYVEYVDAEDVYFAKGEALRSAADAAVRSARLTAAAKDALKEAKKSLKTNKELKETWKKAYEALDKIKGRSLDILDTSGDEADQNFIDSHPAINWYLMDSGQTAIDDGVLEDYLEWEMLRKDQERKQIEASKEDSAKVAEFYEKKSSMLAVRKGS